MSCSTSGEAEKELSNFKKDASTKGFRLEAGPNAFKILNCAFNSFLVTSGEEAD